MDYNHHFHRNSGEYLGSSERQLDVYATGVLEKEVYVIPAQTTLIAPPVAPIGYVACFINEEWVLVEDCRGKTLYKKVIFGTQADEKIVMELGEEKDPEYTLLKPPEPNSDYSWIGEEWAPDQAKIDARLAKEARVAAKIQAIVDNLPTRAHMREAINNISNLADAKAFLLKGFDVVYWLAKDAEE